MGNIRYWLNRPLVVIGSTPISVSTLITLFLIVVISYWLSRFLRKIALRVLSKRNPSAASTLGALIHYVVLVIGFSIALSTAGIDLTALFAAGAVFAVGIGFAMQSIVQNFVSGIILLTERSIKPGDVLEFEGQVVRVDAMGIRSSLVRCQTGDDLIIPNSLLAQNAVRNFTLRDSEYRVSSQVGVSYDSDMKVVRSILEEVGGKMTKTWGTGAFQPQIILVGFGSSSVDWELNVWTTDPWNRRNLTSALYEEIWNALADRGVVIAYPQLDLHLDAPAINAIGGQASVN